VQLSSRFGANGIGGLQVLGKDGGLALCRGWRDNAEGGRKNVLIVFPASERPTPATLGRVAHEYSFKDELHDSWSVKPLELVQDRGRSILVLEDPGGELLSARIGAPIEPENFLRIAIGLAAALGKAHQSGLIHKDIKPTNILVNTAGDEIRLTGFGIASRLTRERQAPDPPEAIAGTLAYMAPEQTGRMNRSIDSRSDLYSLGVTFYEMLTGSLPFTASDPMVWVHCHIARQAHAPGERANGIPKPLSSIAMKLLAKTAEERYQTAAGVEHDLRRCYAEWEMHGRIDEFPLANGDVAGRFLIPEKLYGRSREVAALLESFSHVIATGTPKLVLVSGYSGIGKSSVVNELHKAPVPPRGLFASGKFDQYKRDVPYATVAQAFQTLVRQILSKSEAELQVWRQAVREALGSNGRLIVDLIPELRLIVGEQPRVAELSPQDAQRRFRTVLRRFIGVFARPEHPLALFLDDLQWLDAATLDLLEDLLTQSDVRYLLLIGAYRDNEVGAAHPLMRKLNAIRQAGAEVQDIVLTPLTHDDLRQLISDAVRCETKLANPLVQLVHEKTGGNPFFAIQFLHALADEALLIFNHADALWFCDLNRIHAKRYTDNVVDLMIAKLERLPAETLGALRQLACVGFRANFALLAMVCQISPQALHNRLWEAVRTGLIIRSDNAYTFEHDRIQEAAYSLIPEGACAEAHLWLGRLLLSHTTPDKREESIFEIVSQFNRSIGLIESQAEREEVAELNLAAGKRARNSAAYSSALAYFAQGRTLLAEDCWKLQSRLAFEIELQLADCEVCIGILQAAETRLAALSTRVADAIQKCVVARRRVHLYMMLRAHDRALATGLECLRNVGIECPVHPTEPEARAEYERIWSRLEGSAIEDLVDLTPMTDAGHLAMLDVLTVTAVAAQYSDENLHALSIGRAVNLCLERGNSDAAPDTYAAMGLIASSRFGRHDEGYRFGKMACDLIDRRGLKQFGGGWAYYSFALLVPRTRPFRQGINWARRTFQMAKEHGDPTLAAFGCRALISILIASGSLLEEVERELEQALEFVLPLGFFIDRVSAPLALVRTLRGRTTKFGSLDDGHLTEHLLEERMTGHIANGHLECFYWI
jgi:predicted ATPase